MSERTFCRFDSVDGVCVCEHCGRKVKTPNTCDRVRAPCTPGGHKPRPGLGDKTEALLRRIGVTEDRYKAAKAVLGMAPVCSCGKRKEWLNRASAWWAKEKDASGGNP